MPKLPVSERPVTDVPAAAPEDARAHFARRLAYETDCWDVHEGLTGDHGGFVVFDVRSPEAYSAGHVPGAVSLPHRRISARHLDAWPPETLFVVYCTGPHCNGADKAALAIARLGRPVKKMLGGMSGWREEGFAIETAEPNASLLLDSGIRPRVPPAQGPRDEEQRTRETKDDG